MIPTKYDALTGDKVPMPAVEFAARAMAKAEGFDPKLLTIDQVPFRLAGREVIVAHSTRDGDAKFHAVPLWPLYVAQATAAVAAVQEYMKAALDGV